MEFNLDFLKETGNALKNISKDDQLIKVKGDEVTELSDKKDEDIDVATKAVLQSGDASEAEKIYQEKEGIITTKDKKKENTSEEDLEKKLKNIEKVIETFSGDGGTTVIPNNSQLPTASDINQKPLDMGTAQAKAYQAEYLKPNTVPDDRIALLYENLKKYNLI